MSWERRILALLGSIMDFGWTSDGLQPTKEPIQEQTRKGNRSATGAETRERESASAPHPTSLSSFINLLYT